MVEIFEALIHLAGGVGTVTSANMFDSDYMTADGVTADGKKFTITLNIREENEND